MFWTTSLFAFRSESFELAEYFEANRLVRREDEVSTISLEEAEGSIRVRIKL